MSALVTGASGAAIVHALERAGWTLVCAEINAHEQTARVEVRRVDGRHVTLDARNGRATLTRETVSRVLVTIGRRGDRTIVERLRTDFVGRTRHEGLRSAMRAMAHYIADNAPTALPRHEAKRCLAPLLDAWSTP